jgi:hypothetical protein
MKSLSWAFENYLNLVKHQEINRHGKECSLDELKNWKPSQPESLR